MNKKVHYENIRSNYQMRPGQALARQALSTCGRLRSTFLLISVVFALSNIVSFAQQTVTVNFGTTEGLMAYRAIGLHCGWLANSPDDSYITPIKFKQHRNHGDYCPSVYSRNEGFGVTTHMVCGEDWDIANGWPGDSGNWTAYDNFITNEYNAARAVTGADMSRWYFECWNEANTRNTWNPTGSDAKYSIYDVSGKEVVNSMMQFSNGTAKLNVSNLKRGMYIIKVNNLGKVNTDRFMKE